MENVGTLVKVVVGKRCGLLGETGGVSWWWEGQVVIPALEVPKVSLFIVFPPLLKW